MARGKLTKSLLDGLLPQAVEYFVWDADLAGFGIRVKDTGVRASLFSTAIAEPVPRDGRPWGASGRS